MLHTTSPLRALLPAWIAILLLVTLAARFLPGETTFTISKQPGLIRADIQGATLEVPAESLAPSAADALSLPALGQLHMEPPSRSLYWQPAQDGIFYFIGAAGEWLQAAWRPEAGWIAASIEGDSGTYTLRGGRSLGVLTLVDGANNGFALLVRPERAAIQWWSMQGEEPVQELAETSYRPSGFVSLGDLLAEIALIMWVGSLFGLLAWAAQLALRRISKDYTPPAVGDAYPPQAPRFTLRPAQIATALFVVGTMLSAAACLFVLDGVPHVQDEVAYIFQGRIFAHFRSWAPEPPTPEFFQSSFIQIFEGRWFSKYPPGYPLMLALAIWTGIPWLVNALSAGVSLALVYVTGLRMFSRHVATWAALLGVLSPWVIFMSASYLSHPTTMMWVALFLYALVQLRQAYQAAPEQSIRGRRWGLVAGFVIGMAFITRQWTALGIGLGAAVWAMGDLASAPREIGRKLVPYALVLVGFIPPLVFLLYQNHELTGDLLRLAQDLVGSYDRPGFGPGFGTELGHTPALGVYNTLVYVRTLATVFTGWPAPVALVPIFLGLCAALVGTRRTMAWDALLWLPVAGLVGAYFLWWSSTTIYGPRYWYEAMPFLLLIAGRGLDLVGRMGVQGLQGVWERRVQWLVPGALVALFSIYTLTQSLPTQIGTYTDYNDINAKAITQVTKAELKNAIVFVALHPERTNRDFGKVFFANDPLFEGDVIYARDRSVEEKTYLASLFPDRTPYWLPLDGPPVLGVGP